MSTLEISETTTTLFTGESHQAVSEDVISASTNSEDTGTVLGVRILDVSKIFITAAGFAVNLATVVTLYRNGKGFSAKSKLLLQHQVRQLDNK